MHHRRPLLLCVAIASPFMFCMSSVFLPISIAPAGPSVRAVQDEEATQTTAPPSAQRQDIYDESADAAAQIDAAVARAKKENRRVLIQWGANWCGWCHLLHELMESNQDIARKILYEYEVVLVDIGRFDKNLELAQKYKADFKSHGVPYLTILDGEGNLIANQDTGSLEEGDHHDPAKVMAVLEKHQAPYLNAESVLQEGLAAAAKANKRAFVHFGAPWCGWCHRLEAWMADEQIAKVLARDFVDVKIDTERTIGGQEMYVKFTQGAQGGIPWYAALEADGEVVADSFQTGMRNIGFPYTDEEIEAFCAFVKKAAVNITENDIATLRASLRTTREKINQER